MNRAQTMANLLAHVELINKFSTMVGYHKTGADEIKRVRADETKRAHDYVVRLRSICSDFAKLDRKVLRDTMLTLLTTNFVICGPRNLPDEPIPCLVPRGLNPCKCTSKELVPYTVARWSEQMHVPDIKCLFHKKSENLETMTNIRTANRSSLGQEQIAALFTFSSPSIDNLRTWYRHLATCWLLQDSGISIHAQHYNCTYDGGVYTQLPILSASLSYELTKALDESLDDQMSFWRANPDWIEPLLEKRTELYLTLAHLGSTAAVGANTSQCVATATDVQAADATVTNASATDVLTDVLTDALATDAPATNAPANETPANEPATDAPPANAPATDAPATDAPANKTPANASAPATDAPATTVAAAASNVPAAASNVPAAASNVPAAATNVAAAATTVAAAVQAAIHAAAGRSLTITLTIAIAQ